MWKNRNVEEQKCGRIEMWKYRNVEEQKCGRIEIWKNRNVEEQKCGRIEMQEHRGTEILKHGNSRNVSKYLTFETFPLDKTINNRNDCKQSKI